MNVSHASAGPHGALTLSAATCPSGPAGAPGQTGAPTRKGAPYTPWQQVWLAAAVLCGVAAAAVAVVLGGSVNSVRMRGARPLRARTALNISCAACAQRRRDVRGKGMVTCRLGLAFRNRVMR